MTRLLIAGFALTFAIWGAVSGFAFASRLVHDRWGHGRARVARRLITPRIAALPDRERASVAGRLLSRLPPRAVYRMAGDARLPAWITELCAARTLAHFGLARLARDAARQPAQFKWRRISALFTLTHLRAAPVHAALAEAIRDPDAEVADAAAVNLRRLGDRRAAATLLDGLQASRQAASRIAMQLDYFPIPIDDLLRPLLGSTDSRTRYWAATLMCGYPEAPGLTRDLEALLDDPEPPVRKAALSTLGTTAGAAAFPAAMRALRDPVSFVRSTAVRLIGHHGTDDGADQRQALAASLAPLLSDSAWEVRQAARESLVMLGQPAWRAVAAQLDSADGFARDGAREVLQDLDDLRFAARGA